MTDINFNQLHDYSPKIPFTELDYDSVRLVLDKIADDLWKLSLPNSIVDLENRHNALQFSDAIRNLLPTCCGNHAVMAVGDLLHQISAVLEQCNSDQCNEHNNHEFLSAVGMTIDDRLSSYLRTASCMYEVMSRTN